MALTTPVLDDRRFQDIVDEAKKRINYYCPEWTDHNLSDPGVTLIELFAWMTEMILYRLNQVPELHYIKFLEMLGVRIQEPVPAKVPVTFWLTAPQSSTVVIPAGTEVASTQTETERSVVFRTEVDLKIHPPQLDTLLSRVTTSDGLKKDFRTHDLRRLLQGSDGINIFSNVPQVDDALYFGFTNDLDQHILSFHLQCDPAGGKGSNPNYPPYVFEASTGRDAQPWQMCWVEKDSTKAMNTDGLIQIHVPKIGKHSVRNKDLYWIRVRVKKIAPDEQHAGMSPYMKSPRISKLKVNATGGKVMATHAQQIRKEYLGQSDGTPGQRFHLQQTPILSRRMDEVLEVNLNGGPKMKWREVEDFSETGVKDFVYTLDSSNGEMRFGPAIRQPNGTIKIYGAIPPRGATLTFLQYRSGGGQIGNVKSGYLNTLKTAIPYIARVENLEPARGGLDTEKLEDAMARAPGLLRSQQRAVTCDDYEFLTKQAYPERVGRVKCIQTRARGDRDSSPGQVFVLVIPSQANPGGFFEPDKLELDKELVATLDEYLDTRRLLTTRLQIRPPAYQWVSVLVSIRALRTEDRSAIENLILGRLYQYLNPLTGGVDKKGWPFSRDLYVNDIYQCLQGLPPELIIQGLDLYTADPGGARKGKPVDHIELVSHSVIASGYHQVQFL